MVYNNCTDSGLAGVQVYFQTFKNQQRISERETTSGTGGSFKFENFEIHSDDKFSYAVHIPSKSGIGGNEVAFNGTTVSFSKNDADLTMTAQVTPCFFRLCHTSNLSAPVVKPDSFFVLFTQSKIQSLSAFVTSTLGTSSFGYHVGYSSCFTNYPMGMWQITIDKWKSGIHTTEHDSIYLGWADTKTYTVNWLIK